METPRLFPEPPAATPTEDPQPTRPEAARVVRPVRNQVEWVARDLESALAADHPARAIWDVLERLDLSAFYARVRSVVAGPGRPAADPRVLLGLWLLATVDGVGSARRLARLVGEHDAYRWMAGGVPVNYHQLADFRVCHQEALDGLLSELIASMMLEGLATLERVAQDGMRVRASAGAGSFRRRASLKRCRQEARAQVERLAREREQPEVSRREQAARERAARERLERVEAALERLPEAEAVKRRQGKPEQVAEARVSTTDPEARVMKMADGGFRPAYNLQLATDVASGVVVGVGVTSRGSDQGEAPPMEAQVERRTGRHPARYLVDGGFVKLDDVTELTQRGVTVYAPVPQPRSGAAERAPAQPGDSPEVIAWRERMAQEEAQAIYRRRAASAELTNAQLRERHRLQRFPVRGQDGVFSIALLMVIAYHLMRWISLAA